MQKMCRSIKSLSRQIGHWVYCIFGCRLNSAVVYFLAWFTQALGLLVLPMFCFVLSGEDAGGWWEA